MEEQSLRAYQRRTKAADALIAGAYLSGTNTRRVRRALAALFRGAVSKDTVSRVWRKVKRAIGRLGMPARSPTNRSYG
jgi:putative transposase